MCTTPVCVCAIARVVWQLPVPSTNTDSSVFMDFGWYLRIYGNYAPLYGRALVDSEDICDFDLCLRTCAVSVSVEEWRRVTRRVSLRSYASSSGYAAGSVGTSDCEDEACEDVSLASSNSYGPSSKRAKVMTSDRKRSKPTGKFRASWKLPEHMTASKRGNTYAYC